jgi:hypothetical protein
MKHAVRKSLTLAARAHELRPELWLNMGQRLVAECDSNNLLWVKEGCI